MALLEFHNEQALLERLSTGLKKRPQEVIFLVGAPLTAPAIVGEPGVPDVTGMISLIRQEFDGESLEQAAVENELGRPDVRRYQAAFSFLQGRRGQQTVNEIVCRAVFAARKDHSEILSLDFGNQSILEDKCRSLELDTCGWHLNAGTESLGKLIASYPARFGKMLLTTNFDPLVEISIRRASGQCFRTVLPSDGNLSQTEATGCHVVHLHGFWVGATLHTASQLGQPRPRLKDSLRAILRNRLVVVCAYSGWDDVFTEALMDVADNLTENPEVLWTFYAKDPSPDENLVKRLVPGINRGRLNMYAGVDCNTFFSHLFDRWSELEEGVISSVTPRSNPVRVSEVLAVELKKHKHQHIVEGNDEDRPPLVEFCVGRESEFRQLQESKARVVFITGLGGEGKSTIAAQYFNSSQLDHDYSLYVWRDCKEERERFENQLASVIERLSNGKISGRDLAQQSAASIVEILVETIKGHRILFTFDNVDHYVNLEQARLTGTPALFVNALLQHTSEARVVFTCRPRMEYATNLVLSIHLTGLSLQASTELFSQRGAQPSADEVARAHNVTEGHAFWLDLLAIQVAKQRSANLDELVEQIASGTGLLPEKTLNSIWETLHDREQKVLRAMAETVKPETELEIGDYLTGELTFNKVTRALKTLRTLNLVVVKKLPDGPDLLELHPMVRHFIRSNFPQKDRLSFINLIVKTYQNWRGKHRGELTERPSLLVLQHWTQNAELDIAAGRFKDAFSTLAEVASPFTGSAYPREFTRTVRLLLQRVDWVADHLNYPSFETVFRVHSHILADLGETTELDALLEKYEVTVANKDARYISYCDLRCYAAWVRGDFSGAMTWGKRGQEFKTSAGVDTKFDTSHNYALALRDAGHPDTALPMFLHGRKLADVTDVDELDEKRGGHYYGNIGRCLHFMGQVDEALACYQKSALLLEKARTEHVINEGFIRAWIAELLLARKELKLAYAFYAAAHLKWRQASPPRAAKILEAVHHLESRIRSEDRFTDTEAERVCLDWILGKYVDAAHD